MLLRTFQPLSRVAQLRGDGVLVGDWHHVPVEPLRGGYRAMVAAMAAAGVDTGGNPPIWAWRGALTLLDSRMLLAEHELRAGWATIALDAPTELVVESDYGAWNDHLAALFDPAPTEWRLVPPRPGVEPVQACLPQLRAEWVSEIRPLPTSGWDDLDPNTPA
ncbi:hypothetical protein [Pseudonocardia sp. GCM10023141]|uniref:hypothetical protein n=1 Tax=Pseudonocardia sp. GCM10023141 TaxID=3252653 RepID=UPI00360608DB